MGSKIVVSSTLYNMVGEEDPRPSFLKSTIFSAVISEQDKHLGETLVGSYLTGPGIKQRQVMSYARRKDYSGLPVFSVRQATNVDPAIVASQLTAPDGQTITMQSAVIANADFLLFADRYLLENMPEVFASDWSADYEASTNEITIMFVDGSTEIFTATGYDPNAQYLTAAYYFNTPSTALPLVTGPTTSDEINPNNLPDNSGYTLVSSVDGDLNTFNQQTITTVTTDGGVPVVTTTNHGTFQYQDTTTVETRTEYLGGNGVTTETTSRESILHKVNIGALNTHTVVETVGNVVTQTQTSIFEERVTFRIDIQDTVSDRPEGTGELLIYRIGDGNTVFDDLAVPPEDNAEREFYPFIPIRLNNVSITDPQYVNNGLYEEAKGLYRRASDQNLDELIEQVEDNEDIDDIDYAYVAYGVALSAKENVSKLYIYNFFKTLIPLQNSTANTVSDFSNSIGGYTAELLARENWTNAQMDETNPLYQTAMPNINPLGEPGKTTIQVKTDNALTSDYDQRISWINITDTINQGLGRPNAKRKDVWITAGDSLVYELFEGLPNLSGFADTLTRKSKAIDTIHIYYQVTDNSYHRMTITGLVHNNFVYDGKDVEIGAFEALTDPEVTGFLVPLHEPTLKAMGLVDATQLALSNTYIVFNTFEIVKRRWYQSFIGLLIIFIVVIIVAVVFAPGAVGAAGGLLGTNAAVGASLGFSGTAALLAGVAANAVSAVILSKVLSPLATELLGDKLGAIIGTIVTFAATGGIANGVAGLTSVSGLFSLANVASNAYSGWVQADIQDINNQLIENADDYAEAQQNITDRINELGANNDLYFNPLQLTDTGRGNSQQNRQYIPEGLDEFIQRTTLLGSDIVEITLSMVNNYPANSRQLPR